MMKNHSLILISSLSIFFYCPLLMPMEEKKPTSFITSEIKEMNAAELKIRFGSLGGYNTWIARRENYQAEQYLRTRNISDGLNVDCSLPTKNYPWRFFCDSPLFMFDEKLGIYYNQYQTAAFYTKTRLLSRLIRKNSVQIALASLPCKQNLIKASKACIEKDDASFALWFRTLPYLTDEKDRIWFIDYCDKHPFSFTRRDYFRVIEMEQSLFDNAKKNLQIKGRDVYRTHAGKSIVLLLDALRVGCSVLSLEKAQKKDLFKFSKSLEKYEQEALTKIRDSNQSARFTQLTTYIKSYMGRVGDNMALFLYEKHKAEESLMEEYINFAVRNGSLYMANRYWIAQLKDHVRIESDVDKVVKSKTITVRAITIDGKKYDPQTYQLQQSRQRAVLQNKLYKAFILSSYMSDRAYAYSLKPKEELSPFTDCVAQLVMRSPAELVEEWMNNHLFTHTYLIHLRQILREHGSDAREVWKRLDEYALKNYNPAHPKNSKILTMMGLFSRILYAIDPLSPLWFTYDDVERHAQWYKKEIDPVLKTKNSEEDLHWVFTDNLIQSLIDELSVGTDFSYDIHLIEKIYITLGYLACKLNSSYIEDMRKKLAAHRQKVGSDTSDTLFHIDSLFGCENTIRLYQTIDGFLMRQTRKVSSDNKGKITQSHKKKKNTLSKKKK